MRQTRSTSHTRSISSSSSVKSVQSFTLPDARDKIKRLHGQIEEIEAQRDAAEAHCMLAQRELSTLRFRMNRKEKKKNRRFRTGATLLTSAEGLQLWEVEKKRREEKRQEEAVTQAERKKATEERNIQRCEKATTGIFGGALKPKKKSKLEDIASAFGLPFEGTKAVLMQRIVEHMEANATTQGLLVCLLRKNVLRLQPILPVAATPHPPLHFLPILFRVRTPIMLRLPAQVTTTLKLPHKTTTGMVQYGLPRHKSTFSLNFIHTEVSFSSKKWT